jgi:hypothetical protein
MTNSSMIKMQGDNVAKLSNGNLMEKVCNDGCL